MRFAVRYTYFFLVVGFISSCQRDLNVDTKINKNSCPSSLLVKVITKTVSDSIITEMEYDANGRLSRQFSTYINHPEFISSDWRINRSSSGIITQMITTTTKTQATFADTVNVFYDSNLKRYTHTIQRFDLAGYITKDSIVLIYDAANKLIGRHIYLHHFAPGPYYTLDTKYEYSFNSDGNLLKQTSYDRDQVTNVIELRATVEFTYDNKKRQRHLDPKDGIILSYPYDASHNVTSEKITDFKQSIYSGTYNYQFTYTDCDWPATMVATFSGGNYYRKLYYYYK